MFDNASIVENLVWQMRLGDYSRSKNRARINDLFNGAPPFSEEDMRDNKSVTNVNFLESTTLAHNARRQFYNAFLKSGNYFTVNVDAKPRHKQKKWSAIITKEINKRMKRSLPYFENFRSTFASVVLHGIGPNLWNDKESWCPTMCGVEDVLVPGNTYLTMENLPFFAVYRPYTAMQLKKKISGPNIDAGWNVPLVTKLIEQATKTMLDFGLPNSEIYSPEKLAERFKQDSGFYASDSVATINCFDFYFWNDEGKKTGWNRRIILDANWDLGAGGEQSIKDLKTTAGTRNEFLYNSGNSKVAGKRDEIIHWQFGDLSAVAPFRYHSVRSLGFLVYAVCHLQNRLRCKFHDALFEHMLQYLRLNSPDDAERALKVNLIDKGVLLPGVEFVKAADRWQVDGQLIQQGMNDNAQLIGKNTGSYTQDPETGTENVEKTATQVMTEQNNTVSLVNAALQQAYQYETFKDREIGRRFCIKNSRDMDVRDFRNACLKQGVPEEVLNVECWEIDPERVMGGGNKTVEMQIAQTLMQWRPMFDPEPQREILRSSVLALTDDAAMSDRLVPENPNKVSDSKHDAQLTASALMQGLHVDLKTGENHIEYVETLLQEMAVVLDRIASRGMATEDEIIGLQNMAKYTGQHIAIIAMDKTEKQRVKMYSDDLGKAMNAVKAYAQQLQEHRQKAQENGASNGEAQAEAMKEHVKLAASVAQSKTKSDLARESHAQKTAQRQVQAEMQMQRDAEKHQQDLQQQAEKNALDLAADKEKKTLELEAERARAKEQEAKAVTE
jgi:hypothetical protein